MANQKANVGQSVILRIQQGGAVRMGEVGVIVDITRDYNTLVYVVDFPSQRGYKLTAGDFDVTAGTSIPTRQGVAFDSVIIENQKRQQILEALEQINFNDLIFIRWGFSKTFEKGRGISMLFYGPPGTGKTLMAQAIADKLSYELKVIATAEIESSEPGQAERNIRSYFTTSGGRTILLFDECDSLIYDRSNVGAIMGAQVNELLSSLEKFEGITIFTTNRLGTLDEAVNRRLSLKLEFSMPDYEQRMGIWQRMFPAEAPLDQDVNWEKLAKVEVAGGYIKNSVLRAARMAACAKGVPDTDKKIKMEHLVKALRQEVEAMMEFNTAKDRFRKGYEIPGRPDHERGRGRIKKSVSKDVAKEVDEETIKSDEQALRELGRIDR